MKERRGAGTAVDARPAGTGVALGTAGKRSLVEQQLGAIAVQQKPAN